MHVFVPPSESNAQKKDDFWHKKFLREKKDANSGAYNAYRESIDGLIAHAVRGLVDDARPRPLDVCELCGGDGSLAGALLRDYPWACDSTGEGGIRSYQLFELGPTPRVLNAEVAPRGVYAVRPVAPGRPYVHTNQYETLAVPQTFGNSSTHRLKRGSGPPTGPTGPNPYPYPYPKPDHKVVDLSGNSVGQACRQKLSEDIRTEQVFRMIICLLREAMRD